MVFNDIFRPGFHRRDPRDQVPTYVKTAKPKTVSELPIMHVNATHNNTMITLSDPNGRVLAWTSAVSCIYYTLLRILLYTLMLLFFCLFLLIFTASSYSFLFLLFCLLLLLLLPPSCTSFSSTAPPPPPSSRLPSSLSLSLSQYHPTTGSSRIQRSKKRNQSSRTRSRSWSC